jgi:hypothetical protein
MHHMYAKEKYIFLSHRKINIFHVQLQYNNDTRKKKDNPIKL